MANGLVQLCGQASVVLVLASGAIGESLGTFRPVLYAGAAYLALCAVAGSLLRRGRQAAAR
ncbi:hypothetical protein GCM10028815_26090 [Mariniluteicoccus flavus]